VLLPHTARHSNFGSILGRRFNLFASPCVIEMSNGKTTGVFSGVKVEAESLE
jgi:hypothetical protein